VLPPRLDKELEELSKHYQIEVVEDADFVSLVFSEFPTGPLFRPLATTLLLRIPRSYPDAGPDMFWTSADLTLADSTVPTAGESIETYVGRSWRRFSWHHNRWNGNTDNIATYLIFVRRRFNAR
jgi:Prokaryotic E2 family E